ncbi:hypothetical protein BC937DRAFT_86940 [Endogone sp. FLAS-F59071]|nr:hypothetical protein BC937DRAFT_86940 [Endogone sp. FLAS-F59071]|eukprot:RUS19771.1 hypothetical protein BC937DRAFT_86940 [Endogone sp. FLAS-F59071]
MSYDQNRKHRHGARGRNGNDNNSNDNNSNNSNANKGHGGRQISSGSPVARTPRSNTISQEQKRQIAERRQDERRQDSGQISSDGTDDLIVFGDATGREALQHYALVVLKGSRALDTQHHMRRFINSCLMNLSNHHDIDTSRLLLELTSTSGIARMRDIMLSPMCIDAGLGKMPISFQYVVIPFIGLLTREKICQTTMVQYVNIIYTHVYLHSEQFLLKGVLRCIDELIERQSLQDSMVSDEQMKFDDPTACTADSLPRALLAITRLVFQLLIRIRDAQFEDKFQEMVERLHSQALQCESLPSDVAGQKFEREILFSEIKRLSVILTQAKGLTVESINRARAVKQSKRGDGAANVSLLERSFDPPGDLSEEGPRHDNDKLEISEISVIPTQAEVLCQRLPFLPANDVSGAPHFLELGWKRQLDIHFRLFREDMLNPLRKGIASFLRLLQDMSQKKQKDLVKQGRLRNIIDENIDLNVYTNVRFHGLLVKHQRVSIQISFAPPKSKLMVTAAKRREFWERSKGRLMQGGLVCILWKSTNDDATSRTSSKMVFGVIVERDPAQLSADPERAFITIALTDSSVYRAMLEDAEPNNKSQRAEYFMVESPNVFFESYRPILTALQQKSYTPANLPFGRYLAPSDIQVTPPLDPEESVDPPLYSRAPGFFFDLSVLLRGVPYSLFVTEKESRVDAVKVLREHGVLDDTQSKALVDTLSREVALIKGPPGTGKTKIGVDLMMVFLHNAERMRCGPILCICYTNHALDQFLEHLLDKGIKGIVRIGGRSRSERLQGYSLELLMRSQQMSYDTRQAIQDGKKQWEDVSRNLIVIDKALKDGILPWKYLAPFLMDQCYEQYEQLTSPTLEDGNSDDEDDFRLGETGNEVYARWISGIDIKQNRQYQEELHIKQSHQVKVDVNMFEPLSKNPDSESSAGYWPFPDNSESPITDRPLKQLEQNENLWGMSLKERQRLNDSWKASVQKIMLEELGRLLEICQKIERDVNSAYDEARRLILKRTSVIGMTTNGAARSQGLISSVAPKIIICEEAGEVLESHIIATLSPSTQHLILIGDHLQLRPQVATYDLSADSRVGKNFNLDKSLFERLVTNPINPLPMSYLSTQRRMRPEIANLVRHTLYPDLIDGDSTTTYPPVSGMMKNLYFLNHSHSEDQRDQLVQSFSSSFEVRMVEALVQYLIRNGYDQRGDIAVLTPYLGQLVKLRDAMRRSFTIVLNEQDQEQVDEIDLQAEEEENINPGQNAPKASVQQVSLQNYVTLRTVDNYQGEEAKIVIISLVRNVRAEDGPGRGIGFLKSKNRTNVLLSRARHGMFLLGNADLLASYKTGIWPQIVSELRKEDLVGPGFPIVCQRHPDNRNVIDSPEKFRLVAPHGGCNLPCTYNMNCGHVCPYQCHSDDPQHILAKCLQPCPRLHLGCYHPCSKFCSDDCGSCQEIMSDIVLDCRHTYPQPKCWQTKNPAQISCKIQVTYKMVGCGHEVSMDCSANIENVPCSQPCGIVLPCGHGCRRSCNECKEATRSRSARGTDAEAARVERTYHDTCTQTCDKNLFCGHSCVSNCHSGKDCPPCAKSCVTKCVHFTCQRPCNDSCPACCEACVWECPHQGRCSLPCGAPCNRLPCNRRCDKLLECGHQCPSVCGEVCPPTKFCVVCADENTKDMIVDVILQQPLREVDVNEDPLLVLSCGHALLMSSLDGLMELNRYYVESMVAGETSSVFTACLPLLGDEVKQQSCHLCRRPIVELFRYGRRIKYAQLSMRSKKNLKVQNTKVKEAKSHLQIAQDTIENVQSTFVVSAAKFTPSGAVYEPALAFRKLRSLPATKHVLPKDFFFQIKKYGIPEEQEKLWIAHIKNLMKCYQAFEVIISSSVNSPSKKLFDAAVSHLFRAKTSRAIGEFGHVADTDSKKPQIPATTLSVIEGCILECGIPPRGFDGSSFLESLQEIVNIQLLLHQQAAAVLDAENVASGWYWFTEDLIESILLHVEKLRTAASETKHYRHGAYAHLSLMEALIKKVQLLGRKPMNDTNRSERTYNVDRLSTWFDTEKAIFYQSCPLGIRDECFTRLGELAKRMEHAIATAKSGTFYSVVTLQEKVELFRAISQDVRGSGHWYQCPNGHTYVIIDCGLAHEESRCPECGAGIGGSNYQLRQDNTIDQQFENMMRHQF